LLRYDLEAKRQRDLLQTRIAGTQQLVEQADANERRTAAQLQLNNAQLDQQKALLASLDVQENQLQAQVRSADAQVTLASNNIEYTRILSPADGLVGLRQVRPGQFVNVGTQVISVVPLPRIWVIANFKETQMTNVRLGDPARITVDAFPDLAITGRVDSWSPGTGSTFALLPPDNATGNFTKVVQRVPVKIVLDSNRRWARWFGLACRSRQALTPDPSRTGNRHRVPPRKRALATALRPPPQHRTNDAPSGAGQRGGSGTPRLRRPASAAARGFVAPVCRNYRRTARINHRDTRRPGDQLRVGRFARRSAGRLR